MIGRGMEQYKVVEDLHPGCSRARDPLTGESVLLHRVVKTSETVELLERSGFVRAQGERSGSFCVATQDRPELIDLAQWVQANRPGEFTAFFHAENQPGSSSEPRPGEFTSLFPPAPPAPLIAAPAQSAGDKDVPQTPVPEAADLSSTKTMVRPILLPKSEKSPSPAPPPLPLPPPKRAPQAHESPANPIGFTNLFEKVRTPELEPRRSVESSGASGIFAPPAAPLEPNPEERTRLFPAFPENNVRTADNSEFMREFERNEPGEIRGTFPITGKKPVEKPDRAEPGWESSDSMNATRVFSAMPANPAPGRTDPIPGGPGDYTRVFRRAELETPGKAAAEPAAPTLLPSSPPPTTGQNPDSTKPLLIAIVVLGSLLLFALVTIIILLLRR